MSNTSKTKKRASNNARPKSNDEYDRFEELTRRLVRVPKKEVDEQRERERSEKRPD